eukprot:scaffold37972_cov40-Prasinocladus_malaysianus.AAC.1
MSAQADRIRAACSLRSSFPFVLSVLVVLQSESGCLSFNMRASAIGYGNSWTMRTTSKAPTPFPQTCRVRLSLVS